MIEELDAVVVGGGHNGLTAAAYLARAGLRDDIIVEIAAIYSQGIEAMQTQVLDLFAGRRGPSWDPDELQAFQDRIAQMAGSLVPLVTRVVSYAHSRTLQRLTLGAIEEGRASGGEG